MEWAVLRCSQNTKLFLGSIFKSRHLFELSWAWVIVHCTKRLPQLWYLPNTISHGLLVPLAGSWGILQLWFVSELLLPNPRGFPVKTELNSSIRHVMCQSQIGRKSWSNGYVILKHEGNMDIPWELYSYRIFSGSKLNRGIREWYDL